MQILHRQHCCRSLTLFLTLSFSSSNFVLNWATKNIQTILESFKKSARVFKVTKRPKMSSSPVKNRTFCIYQHTSWLWRLSVGLEFEILLPLVFYLVYYCHKGFVKPFAGLIMLYFHFPKLYKKKGLWGACRNRVKMLVFGKKQKRS